jgi:tetratricopeptide (TPR) repeat protein
MRIILFLITGLAVAGGLAPCVVADSTSTPQDEPLANANLSGLYANSIEKVLNLPPDQIDIGIAALIVSEAWSDMVSGRRYQQRLDDMAIEIRSRLKAQNAPVGFAAIPIINDYLFDELRFSTIDKTTDPYDLFLHSVMDRRRGYCLSLSILYLAIGERLGLPLYGVVVPGHFFVRYDDSKARFNIETTNGGASATDDYYIQKFNVPKNNTIYMSNLNKRQSLGCFFNNLGNIYKDIGNVDQAMASMQWAVYINPSLAESRINLGNIYMKKDRVDDAIAEYQQALKITPDDSKAHNNLGNAFMRRQSFNDAVAEYTASIRLEPNFVDPYRNIAFAYRRLNRLTEAAAALTQAITLEPQNSQIYQELAEVYAQSDNCAEAVPLYEKALKLKPDVAEVYLGLGLCYNKLEQTDKEIEAYQKALSINPDMFVALARLGYIYFSKGKFDAAIEEYNKAVRLNPDGKLYYNIGAAYSNKGDYEQAVKAQLKAVELDPQMADAHYSLALAYYKLGNYDSALKHIKTAEHLGATIDPNLLNAIEHKN